MTGERPSWMSDPDLVEDFFHDAVRDGNAERVEVAIRLMLVIDPERGVGLYDGLKLALRVSDLLDVATGLATPKQLARLIS